MNATYEQIKALGPCYDPVKYIPADFKGSILDILKMDNVPAKDRLWVAVRAEFLTDKQIQAYGLACARLSEKYSTDERVKACNDIVERYLKGAATKEELSAAESAAWSAAWSAWSAAWSAWSAAEFAARSARSAAESARSARSALSAAESAARSARSAAESARSARSARSAAESAARSAAESAAESAAWSAAESAAWSAAESAAWSAIEEQQVNALITILEKSL